MTYVRTLRARIVFAFAVFGLILSVALATAVYFGFHAIEELVVRDAMRAELALARESGTDSTERPAQLLATTIYSALRLDAENLPDYLEALTPGFHRVAYGDRRFVVLVEEHGDERYVASYDETRMARRARFWFLGLAACVAVALAVSVWIGYAIAGRIIRPVTQLTANIRALDSGRQTSVELRKYADDEVGWLARAFRDYHERIDALMTREREFAGNVSHELRTPVTSINLAVEVLAEDATMSEQQRYRLQRIRRAGREMSELINTFLLLSRHEDQGNEDAMDCDVNGIVRDVVENQKVWIGDKSVSTRVIDDAELTVRAPRGVVAVLIGNVVRNAYRYTQAGLVTIRVAEDRIVVEDSGPGIDAETRAHIFERNVQGTTSDQGAGLGLSIVKRLCERYGWHVEVSSTVGAGSRFDLIMRDV